MTTPTRWRDEPRPGPTVRAANRALDALVEPAVPAGARARVRARLDGERRDRGWGGLLMAWGAVAAAMGALLVTGLRTEVPTPSASPTSWVAVEDPLRIELDVGRFELAPASHLVRAPDAPLVLELQRGRVWAAPVQSELRLVAGRYEVRPEARAAFWLQREPFEVDVEAGAVRVLGPDGTHRLVAAKPAPAPTASLTPTPTPTETPPAAARARAPRPANVAPASPGGARFVAGPEDWGARYRAARAERDPDMAVRAFDRILAHGGPWAEMAGHQAVRRRMQQARYAEALERLDALEARFPEGAHRPEVWLARVDIRVVQDALPRARADIDRYLAAHADSLRAPDLFFLRGEIHRRAGRAAKARQDYLRVTRGRYLAEARRALTRMKNGPN